MKLKEPVPKKSMLPPAVANPPVDVSDAKSNVTSLKVCAVGENKRSSPVPDQPPLRVEPVGLAVVPVPARYVNSGVELVVLGSANVATVIEAASTRAAIVSAHKAAPRTKTFRIPHLQRTRGDSRRVGRI